MKGVREALVALGAGALVQRAATFVVVLVLARGLGVEAFGEFAVAQQIGLILALFADFGVRPVVARELTTTDADPGTWIRAAMRTRLVLGAGLLLAYAAVLPFVPLDPTLALLCAAVVLPMACDLKGIADGLGRTGQEVRLEVVATTCNLLAVAALALAGALTPMHVAVASLASRCVYAVGALRSLPRAAAEAVRPSWRRLLRSGGPVSIAQVAMTITQMADVVLIRLVLGAEAAGIYAAVDKLVQAAGQPVVLLTRSLQPHLQRAAAAHELPATLHRAIRGAGYVVLPFAAGGIVLADHLIVPLFGPDYFAASGWTLRWLLLGTAVLGVGGRYNDCLFAQHRAIAFAAPLLLGAAVNIGGTLLLLPHHGVPGAALATAAAAATIAVGSFVLVRARGPAPLWHPLGPPTLVAIATAAAAAAVPPAWGLAAQLAAGGVAFCAFVAVFERPLARRTAVAVGAGAEVTAGQRS